MFTVMLQIEHFHQPLHEQELQSVPEQTSPSTGAELKSYVALFRAVLLLFRHGGRGDLRFLLRLHGSRSRTGIFRGRFRFLGRRSGGRVGGVRDDWRGGGRLRRAHRGGGGFRSCLFGSWLWFWFGGREFRCRFDGGRGRGRRPDRRVPRRDGGGVGGVGSSRCGRSRGVPPWDYRGGSRVWPSRGRARAA